MEKKKSRIKRGHGKRKVTRSEKCAFCGSDFNGLPFKCKYCGKKFCVEHRLPEDHECKTLAEHKQKIESGEIASFSTSYNTDWNNGLYKKPQATRPSLFTHEYTPKKRGFFQDLAARFSGKEIADILVAWITLSFAFSFLLDPFINSRFPFVFTASLIVLLFAFIDRFFYPVYIGYQKMKYGFIIGVVFDSLRIVQLAIVYLGFGLLGLITFYDVIYLSVVSISVFFVYRIVAKNKKKRPIKRKDVASFNSYRKFSYGTSLISSLYGPFIIIFLGAVSPGIQFVSFYRVGILMAAVIGMPAAAMGSAFFPTITKYFQRKEMDKFYRLQRVLLRYSALITLPLVVGSFVAVGPLIDYLYKATFSGAGLPFIIMLLSVLITGIFGPIPIVLSAIGKQKFFMYSTIGGALAGISLTVLLVPFLLSTGAAIVYLGVSITILSINIFFSLKYIRISLPVTAIAKGAVASVMMAAVIYILLRMTSRLFLLPLILIFSLFVYLVLIYLLGAINKQDIIFISKLLRISALLKRLSSAKR